MRINNKGMENKMDHKCKCGEPATNLFVHKDGSIEPVCLNCFREKKKAVPDKEEDTTPRENLADYAHRAWSGWMVYMFSMGSKSMDGSITIPKSFVDRWTRQMNTEYKDLPESEKASDLKEADEMLRIMKQQ